MKTLIIIPAYNEAASIEKVIDNLIENYPQYDYVIINDGSTDDTKKICKKKGYHILNLSVNLGIGGAVQTGYVYARENGYDATVQIDGDGQHDVFYLADMLKLLETKQADVVIGSRFIEKEGFQSSQLRRVGIRFLSFLVFLMTGKRVLDVTSGYRVVNRQFLKIYAEDYPGDYPEPEAIVIAAIHGAKIKESPVVMREREAGSSSISLKKSIYYMIKVSIGLVIRRISFGIRRVKL